MSFQTFMFKHIAKKSDAKRDANLVVPDNIHMDRDINYVENGDEWNLWMFIMRSIQKGFSLLS